RGRGQPLGTEPVDTPCGPAEATADGSERPGSAREREQQPDGVSSPASPSRSTQGGRYVSPGFCGLHPRHGGPAKMVKRVHQPYEGGRAPRHRRPQSITLTVALSRNSRCPVVKGTSMAVHKSALIGPT